ncbi:MAG: PepSY-associated TM helix domain-containing protein [Candidatus Thiodiazotropha sp.]
MNLKTFKPILHKLHRWIGVSLAPLFLLIALSGAVLAFKPITQGGDTVTAGSVSGAELITFLQQIDPLGQEVDRLRVDASATQVEIRSHNPELQGRYALDTGVRLAGTTEAEGFDLFEFAEHLHKELLIGVDVLVQIASYLMLFLVISAPLLSWPRLRNNLMGWHRAAGWLLLPVVVMLPLTGVLMSLHVGMPELPRMSQPGNRLSLEQGLRQAQLTLPLEGVEQVRRFRGGTILLGMQQSAHKRLLVVTDESVKPIHPEDNLVKTLHEGTWAGPWSGLFNLLGATALSLLGTTGFISWWRRRIKRRHQRAGQRTAEATA